MCLIVIAWQVRDDLPLVVAANRDEWRDRPSTPAHWWPAASGTYPAFLAGQDLQAGGTWMGISRSGRWAAVTNFRDPADRRSTARSRGGLVTQFLQGNDSPRDYLGGLAGTSGEYNGFNLIAGDRDSLWYLGSRKGEPTEIPAGIHGLSNHVLDEPWPKVVKARHDLEAAIATREPVGRLFDALSDTTLADDAALSQTGVGIAWERRLAPALITGSDYGTRCTTVITRSGEGDVHFEERSRGADGSVSGTVAMDFRLAR